MTLPVLKWEPSPNFSERAAGVKLDLIVLHEVVGSYGSAIATFKGNNNGRPVSAHFVVREDGLEVTQMVPLHMKAWHACDFNSRSIGIEMGGMSTKDLTAPEMDEAAKIVAFLCKYLQIPCLCAHRGIGPGITTHYELGAAGGGHTDPASNYDWLPAFYAKVKAHYDQGDFPSVWQNADALRKCSLHPHEV